MRAIGIHTSGLVRRLAEVMQVGDSLRVVRLESNGATSSAVDSAVGETVCFASLPAAEVLTRVLMLPASAPAKLRAMVGHQLEADLPIPIEQLQWDCRFVRPAEGANVCVLAQASRTDRIRKNVESLAASGLAPAYVTTEAEGISCFATRVLSLGKDTTPFALVMAGEREWVLAIFRENLALAVRRISFDAADPDASSRAFGEAVVAQAANAPIGGIWWLGRSEARDGLEAIARQFNVPLQATSGHLLDQANEAISVERLVEFGPAIGLAIAAAEKNESLIRLGGGGIAGPARPKNRIDSLLAQPRRIVMAAGIGLIAATGIHLASIHAETGKMQKQMATTSAPADLDTKVRGMERLKLYRIDVEGIYADVAKVLPDSTILSSVSLAREHRLVIKGTSKDAKAPYTLADALRKNPARFANVTPDRSSPGQGGEFTVTADVVGIQKVTAVQRGRGR